MKQQKLLKALVVLDGREDSWFMNGGFHESIDRDQLDVRGLPVNMQDINGTLRMIAEQAPDVLLLDSTLTPGFMTSMVTQVRYRMPHLPIVLLPDIHGVLEQTAGLPDAMNGSQAHLGRHLGGQAHLVDTMARTIHYTHGQLGLQRTLLHMALRDDLTGLHNRRGFIALATRYLKWARDSGQHVAMFFGDIDGLKSINDRYGHAEGDRAISLTAACIKDTFRRFDVTARLSGDEFVALIAEVPGRSVETICKRLQTNLAARSVAERPYAMSLSIGVAHFDPDKPVALQELMRQADIALYRHKRRARRMPEGAAAANPEVPARAGGSVMRAALGEPAVAASRG